MEGKICIREEYAPKLNGPVKKDVDNQNLQSIKEHLVKIYEKLDAKQNPYLSSEIKNIEGCIIDLNGKLDFQNEMIKNIEVNIENLNKKLELQNHLLISSQLKYELILKNLEDLKFSIQNTDNDEIKKLKESMIQPEEFSEILIKSKEEYISALQCEMEICRQNITKDIYRNYIKDYGSMKGHGDPFLF